MFEEDKELGRFIQAVAEIVQQDQEDAE
jgi:hypothetical protein